MGHLDQPLLHLPKLREHCGKGGRKKVIVGGANDFCEMLSSGYDTAAVFIHSQHLWLPAQEQANQNTSIDVGEMRS